MQVSVMEPISRPDLPDNPDLMDELEERWYDPRCEIKSAKCRCEPDQKAKSRALFDSGREPNTSLSDLRVGLERVSLDKINPLKRRNSSAIWASLKKWMLLDRKASSEKRVSLMRGDASDGKSVLESSPRISSARLHTLPPEILYPILGMVYEDEDRSRGLCRCSRPKTPYYKIRKISLEHHVVNTAPLRSICHSFHAWALENVFKGRDIEVDLSDFKGLQRRFGTNGAGVVKRFVEDFPRLGKEGVVTYLGNPGQISNIRSVVDVMRNGQANFFTGVTLWDLDYYHREHIPALPKLAFSKINNANALSTSELDLELKRVMLGFVMSMYYEDRLLFVELLLRLAGNSLPPSTLHVPVASFLGDSLPTIAVVQLPDCLFNDEVPSLDLSPKMSGSNSTQQKSSSNLRSAEYPLSQDKIRRTLAEMTRGCTTIVFREFGTFNDAHISEVRQYVEASKHRKAFDNCPPICTFELDFDDIERHLRTRILAATVDSVELSRRELLSEPLDARRIEFHPVARAGGRPPWMNGSMPLRTSVESIAGKLRHLVSLVIDNGTYDELSAGTLLHTLLPLRQTLSTLIYKTAARPGWALPRVVVDPIGAQHSMDPHHTCLLLQQFPKLKKLDLASRICHELFNGHGDDWSETARTRDWNVRLPTGWSLCSYDEGGNPSLATTRLWTQGLIHTFLQSCRAWRDRYEASTNRKTSWNIKFHVEVWECWFELGDHSHQIAFMPLARPPCAWLMDCDEGMHEEGLYEEKGGWMVMHMLSGRPSF